MIDGQNMQTNLDMNENTDMKLLNYQSISHTIQSAKVIRKLININYYICDFNEKNQKTMKQYKTRLPFLFSTHFISL